MVTAEDDEATSLLLTGQASLQMLSDELSSLSQQAAALFDLVTPETAEHTLLAISAMERRTRNISARLTTLTAILTRSQRTGQTDRRPSRPSA